MRSEQKVKKEPHSSTVEISIVPLVVAAVVVVVPGVVGWWSPEQVGPRSGTSPGERKSESLRGIDHWLWGGGQGELFLFGLNARKVSQEFP